MKGSPREHVDRKRLARFVIILRRLSELNSIGILGAREELPVGNRSLPETVRVVRYRSDLSVGGGGLS